MPNFHAKRMENNDQPKQETMGRLGPLLTSKPFCDCKKCNCQDCPDILKLLCTSVADIEQYGGLQCSKAADIVQYGGLQCSKVADIEQYGGLQCSKVADIEQYGGLQCSKVADIEQYGGLQCSKVADIEQYGGLQCSKVADIEPYEGLQCSKVADIEPYEGLQCSKVADIEPYEGLQCSKVADIEPYEGLQCSKVDDSDKSCDFGSKVTKSAKIGCCPSVHDFGQQHSLSYVISDTVCLCEGGSSSMPSSNMYLGACERRASVNAIKTTSACQNTAQSK